MYDGHHFTNFTENNGVKHGMINEIIELQQGKMLVAQNYGQVDVFENGKNRGVFMHGNDTINYLLRINKNSAAAVSNKHLYKWVDDKLKRIGQLPEKFPSYVSQINDSIWIGFENNQVQLYDSLLQFISADMISQCTILFVDHLRRAWIGTNHGLKLLSTDAIVKKKLAYEVGKDGTITTLLPGRHINYVFEDDDHRVWIGTLDGLYKMNSDSHWEKFSKAGGLPSDIITHIMQDREKNIWVGTSAGLAKIPMKNSVRIIGTKEGLSSHMEYSMHYVDSAEILLFSEDKTKLDPATGSIKHEGKLDHQWLPHFDINHEEIITFENKKAYLYKTGNNHPKQIPWPTDTHCFSILQVKENTYLVGLQEGFRLVANNQCWSDTISLPYRISCMVKDRNGRIWAGTFSDGLYWINYTLNGGVFKIQATRIFQKQIPDERIRSLFIDSKNNIWVGARFGGVFCIQPTAANKYHIKTYNVRSGLSANWVTAITEDPKGNIWIGSAQGIDKLIPGNGGYRIFNFGKMNHLSFPINKIKFIPTGQMLAAGLDGLIIAHDEELDTISPGKVFITNIKADFEPVNENGSSNHHQLSYKNSGIRFAFASPNYFNEKCNSFTYRLLGSADTSWTVADNSQSVNYANLQPGIYNFEVRVAGWNGEWSEAVTYKFSVNKPYWQTLWFILLAAMLLAALLYAIYRYRVTQLLRLQKVRNAIATDLHDEIGSTLTNINILSTLSRNNLEKPKEAQNFLGRISEEVSNSMQALDDIIWSVNSKNDSLGESVLRMRRYAAELFDAGQIDYDIKMDERLEEKKLSMQQRRDLYLLYKEIVNNIYKHAAASKVNIELGIHENKIVLLVIDDGVGYDAAKSTNRNGIRNMHLRVGKWNGSIHITTSPGKGTNIQINLPIDAK
jgi:signal transduction histidine kinase